MVTSEVVKSAAEQAAAGVWGCSPQHGPAPESQENFKEIWTLMGHLRASETEEKFKFQGFDIR